MARIIGNQLVDVDSLPTLPSIASEAVRLMEGENSSFHSIAELLKNDQVLSSKILHYANAGCIGAARRTTSLSQAISLLGFNTVRSIILSVSIFDCFSGRLARKRQKSLVNFWLHSIGVAATAEILARKLAFPAPEEAYMAGLIHDLGKLVSFIQQPDKFEEVCRTLDAQGAFTTKAILPLEVEKSILGSNHVEFGKLIADRWGFPEPLGRVMWLHHQPAPETILPEEVNLPELVRFADVLCVTHNVGSSYFLTSGNYCHDHFHFALENMVLHHNLTPSDIDGIMRDVHKRVREVADFLGIWDEEEYRRLISSANVSLGGMSMNLERNNRRLTEMSRVLDTACEMTRELTPDLSLGRAARTVAAAAGKAFGVHRCLCIIRDDANQVFQGRISEGDAFHEVCLPMHIAAMKKIDTGEFSDIETEALLHLERTSAVLSEGGALESGMINMLAGSRFLATFFVADKNSLWRQDPIFGELVVDFGGAPDLSGDGLDNLKKRFEALALAAGNAIERILLEQDLLRQAQQMTEASRKMEESQRQLFHSHRLATVGRLAAGAAHEINNPLTIISLNAQVMEGLLTEAECGPEAMERLKTISEQGERISKIIQDLMGFAHPARPELRLGSVADIMGKVLSVLGDRVSMAEMQIKNRIPKDVPPVMVDPLQIEQVFMNLLINAIHAMPEGGTITVSAAAGKGFVETCVADTGEGIARENFGKIFDPFFTTKKEGEGAGLGLAVCHAIVEHNDGYMKVESKPGAGAAFTVVLPTDKGGRLREMKQSIEQHQAAAPVEQAGKYRLLVIDDERAINDTVRDTLLQAGYDVDCAYDGVEGIGLLRYQQYDLVLLDIRMPRKDGLEVLQFIRDEYPDVMIIIMTGLASVEDIQDTVRMGAFACLKKPFRLEEVLDTVGRALKQSKKQHGK